MKNKKPGILVGLPVHSNVNFNTTDTLLKLQEHCIKNDIPFDIWYVQNSLITTNRNNIVAHFLESDEKFTHLFFVDSDVHFFPSLVQRMLDYDKDVICGVYPKKNINWHQLYDALLEEKIENVRDLEQAAYVYPFKGDPKSQIQKDGLLEITHAATGCLLLKRSVFHKMIKKYPKLKINEGIPPENRKTKFNYNFFDCYFDTKEGKYYGEDFGFSRLWTKTGGKIWAVANANISHIGDWTFQGNLYDYLKLNNK